MSKLDVGKLTSVDEKGDRLQLIPAEVHGFYHKHKRRLHLVLLLVFLLLPWTHINDLQTLLLDIPKREFSFFGVLLKAHDVPLLFFILATAALGLAFVTSIWGRVWCGWACPQTVFIETVFRRIEILVEGNYIERRRLKTAPLNLEKFLKRGIKWTLFVIVSSLIAHSFMAYFVGSRELLEMMQKSPAENSTYFYLTLFFTSIILFNFAWFREQFCVIMCPYGRIQSLLLDRKSLAVVYDVKRGEPRKDPAVPPEKRGDCVSCNRCVEVCPTGIDIRNGLQMECIACTACIDACDEIMTKVKKPTGLIRYDTLDGSKMAFFKARSLIYMALIALFAGGFAYNLSQRGSINVTFLRGKGAPYSEIGSENGQKKFLNQFHVHIQNQTSQEQKLHLKLSAAENPGVILTVAENPILLKGGSSRDWYFFVHFYDSLTADSGRHPITLEIWDENILLKSEKINLLGPKKYD